MAERVREVKIKATPSLVLVVVETTKARHSKEYFRALEETDVDLLRRATEATVDQIQEIRRNP